MNRFSEKIFLTLPFPTEEDSRSDQKRLLDVLSEKGFAPIQTPLTILRKLHNTCIQSNYQLTVTLVYCEEYWQIVDLEAGDTSASHYGLAVDYGSTSIIMQLVDLHTGSVLAKASQMNGQVIYGTDILTRITYTMEDSSHIDNLHKATIETFHSLLQQITNQTGIPAETCPIMIVSGNTTMIHFLLKLDASTVFFSPYAPATMNPGWFFGTELGMNFSGMLYIIPAASNYVGGDIVSGLLNLDFCESEEIKLFFDIGTNGELVIGNRDWMLAGAGAAGPALEGYISRYGIRAQKGAIDTIKINQNQLSFTTIENAAPIGICGSGIIDLIAQMRLHGWIDIAGKLNPEASQRILYLEEEQQYVVVYATEQESATKEPLYFSQTDLDQYLDTKAAAFTMIDCLLDTAGCTEADIARCYLSGAFTAHSDLDSAITIGIFPDLPRERYTSLSNSSLDGARILLLDRSRMSDIRYFIESMYCVQFASIPDFMIRMQAAKFIPHTNMERFPIIKHQLEHTS